MSFNDRFYSSSLLIEIQGNLREEILDWGYHNVKNEDVFNHIDYPQIGRENNPHCTILYSILDNSPEQIQKVLTGEPSFELELGRLSLFESDLYSVFKIDVKSKGLDRLYRVASNCIPHRTPYFDFSPHITIAFMKKYAADRLLNSCDKKKFEGKKFKAEELCFNSPDYNRKTIIDLSA